MYKAQTIYIQCYHYHLQNASEIHCIATYIIYNNHHQQIGLILSLLFCNNLYILLPIIHYFHNKQYTSYNQKNIFLHTHFLGINVLFAYSLIYSKSPVLKIFVPHLSRFSEKILGEINPLSIAYSISRENSVQKKSSCALAFNKNFSS